jgi:hypothetical protein
MNPGRARVGRANLLLMNQYLRGSAHEKLL